MSTTIDRLFREPPADPTRPMPIPELKILLQRQASLIASVATGGPSIQSVNENFEENDRILRWNFRRLGIEYPFPWTDLWDWYGFYSANTSRYQERRDLVRDYTRPALEGLRAAEQIAAVVDFTTESDPTWDEIGARIAGLITEMNSAHDRDAWQDVGRRSREILIDLVRVIAHPSLVPTGIEPPQAANVKAWYDLFIATHAAGANHDELRRMLRATWDLANKVTHGDIGRVDAYASAQGTILVVRATQMLLSATDSQSDIE